MQAAARSDPDTLIRQARGGSQQAIGELMELYRNYLTLLARIQLNRQLQTKIDASDIVQDLLLEVCRVFPSFRGDNESQLLAWLRQILASTLASNARRYQNTRRRDLTLERNLEQELNQTSQLLDQKLVEPQTPSQAASQREQAVLIADALAALQPDYREAIVLRYFEGQTFPEIAARMKRSVDSVRKLWLRGLIQLRAAVEEHDER